ncbi:MAG TPA: M56 family metallopeptidase [Syntrophomonadaceae bacterium]|nr:M56 family metallopeptidase [Syntrophomonadaceae bacterium]
MNLTELFRCVVSLSIAGSILAIGLWLIKLLLREKLSAKWQYYIWFLLCLRLVVPFTPASFSVFDFIPHGQEVSYLTQVAVPDDAGTSVASASNQDQVQMTSGTFTGNNYVRYPADPTSNASPWFSWQTLALVWIIGVIAIFMYMLFINGMLFFKIKRLPACTSKDILKILHDCEWDLKLRTNVSVAYNDSLKSPGLFGIFRPKIIICPEIIKKLSREELRHIFLHELSHLKRRDLLINAMVSAIQLVYWFNPLVWYALSHMKQDCEIACDATVLAALKPEDHRSYGQTIISLMQMLSQPRWAPGILGFISKFNTRRIIMISTSKKTTLKWAIVALALLFAAGCSSLNSPLGLQNSDSSQKSAVTSEQKNQAATQTSASKIAYKNTVYGFNFTLPSSWQGYSTPIANWDGNDVGSGKITETGPMITIRHPQWKTQKPRQDIPIMIFTRQQWESLQQGKFHIGAAPMGPSELGRNGSYVFALPARYNYAFLTGYEEVEKILKGNPLQAADITNSDSAAVLLLNMMQLAKQGKVINCEFAVKTSNFGDVQNKWGQADNTAWVQAAKGTYSTYSKKNVAFGWNKGMQIFEVRSFDRRFKTITLAKVKEVLGTPAYDSKTNNQEIIGYKAGTEFKIEMVFNQPKSNEPNLVMVHYNVLFPSGTVNSMANDPGREW